MARFLLGPIAQVNARLETVNKTRPAAPGSVERREVKVDDIARLIVKFERGCSGSIEANWVATGRKMHLEFEVYGTKGTLLFSQERFNELQYFKSRSLRLINGGVGSESDVAWCVAANIHVCPIWPWAKAAKMPAHSGGQGSLTNHACVRASSEVEGVSAEPDSMRSIKVVCTSSNGVAVTAVATPSDFGSSPANAAIPVAQVATSRAAASTAALPRTARLGARSAKHRIMAISS
ncbi:Gfo/Idh/MocA family protein [Paraburkholderia sp. HD33-4]|uniref:Gfo/Idh/MocA family protein n=1 Tax=Paraburkholderia sp. HD33-4 TaxID=2883242 RepID=UPI001F3919CF|nr:Gfo/Idh/MocA family oxidoreductase [Paraburkholderia sp. HD33-4]